MALEKFKQGQSLKSELEQLSSEYSKLVVADKQRILESIANEFIDFLSSEGFKVARQGTTLRADYSGVQLVIEMPQATDSYMGCISVLPLADSRNPREKWALVVLQGKNPSTNSRVSIRMESNDEDTRLKTQIEELKDSIATFKPKEFSIMYYRDQGKVKEGPVANSLKDALIGILNQ